MKKSRIILAIVMFVSVLVLFSYMGTYGENVSDTQFSGAVLDQADFNRAFVGEGDMTRNVGDSLSTPVSCSTGNIQLNYQSIGSRAS